MKHDIPRACFEPLHIVSRDFFFTESEIFWLLTKRLFGRKSVKVDKTEPRNGQLPKRKWNKGNKMNDELLRLAHIYSYYQSTKMMMIYIFIVIEYM